jgi:uncharacterized protein YihD (DUF1040 family)
MQAIVVTDQEDAASGGVDLRVRGSNLVGGRVLSCVSGPVMRDANRIPMILAALERRWSQESDLRLGQLLVNVTQDLGCEAGPLFELTDGELLRRLGAETDDERRYVRDEPAAGSEACARGLQCASRPLEAARPRATARSR